MVRSSFLNAPGLHAPTGVRVIALVVCLLLSRLLQADVASREFCALSSAAFGLSNDVFAISKLLVKTFEVRDCHWLCARK
jgi:hypothetical protein